MALRGYAHRARSPSASVPPVQPVAPAPGPWEDLAEELAAGPEVSDLPPEIAAELDEAGGFSIEQIPGSDETSTAERGDAFQALYDQPTIDALASATPIESGDDDGQNWVETLIVDAAESSEEIDPDAPEPLDIEQSTRS
jgi:hypothetical protein